MQAKQTNWMRKNSNERGYDYRWRKSRELFLQLHPLCKFHEDKGKIVPANVVDHIVPHRGDMKLFWDVKNWQPLCKQCHDSAKQKMELGSYEEIGEDGWPIEQNGKG